ncbi:MAG: YicC/YloC family endoribonuclease [Eubacteriales bacterium]
MIKSMTGFGRGEYSDGRRNIIVEIKAVNHRYSDIAVKMPRRYSFTEDRIKSIVKEVARRGKIEVSIIVENLTEDDMRIRLNEMVAQQYYENLQLLKSKFELAGDITLNFLANMPDVLRAIPDVDDEEIIMQAITKSVKIATEKLDEMRKIEGSKLSEDIISRGELIRKLVDEISKEAGTVAITYTAKIKERIKELIGNSIEIPEDRILMEAAIYADKCSITEELVRLDSHIIQLENIISKSNQPDGKKLDFLVQEMNREANTIGSKANNIEITNVVIEIKSEIEKIREQVQNIE